MSGTGREGPAPSQEFPPGLGLGARPRWEGSRSRRAGPGREARSAAPRASSGQARGLLRPDPAAPRPLARGNPAAPRGSLRTPCRQPLTLPPQPAPHPAVPKLCANPPPPSQNDGRRLFLSRGDERRLPRSAENFPQTQVRALQVRPGPAEPCPGLRGSRTLPAPSAALGENPTRDTRWLGVECWAHGVINIETKGDFHFQTFPRRVPVPKSVPRTLRAFPPV